MALSAQHEYFRNNVTWMANSRTPIKSYIVRDLSNDHLRNIIRDVTHLSRHTLSHLTLELEFRRQGLYPDVEEYS